MRLFCYSKRMTENSKEIRIGVGLIIVKNGKVLMSKRKNAHGSGTFAGPGGSLEYMESPRSAVLRELKEECGNDIKISDPELLCVVNWEEYAPIHFIGIGFLAIYISVEAEVVEPDKFESWDWYDLRELPRPLFGVMESYLEALTENKSYIES